MKRLLITMTLAGLASSSALAATPQDILTKGGCLACHAVDKKIVGPSYKQVAVKYKGDAGAEAKLVAKVRKGGSGVWGPVPMPPHTPAQISDADLKTVVDWILKQ
ncbi:MAG: c-type cytochrome [Caldimonas sp.]